MSFDIQGKPDGDDIANFEKHMVHLIAYGLTKPMYTNDMGIVRVHSCKDSMKRLDNTAKLRFNPQIPRS